VAGDQGVWVLGAQDPLLDGQQGGVLVAGPGRIPRLPEPAGEAAAGGEGVPVFGPVGVALAVGVGEDGCAVAPDDRAVPGLAQDYLGDCVEESTPATGIRALP
jgi:hypothetical protein